MRKRFLAAILAPTLLALCGCSGLLNGYFLSRGLPHQFVMVHLVESPRVVLTGTLEVTGLNQTGSTANVRDYNVQGTITGANVSLWITGALATIAGWFGNAPVLVGTLEDGRLTLSHGADTATLWRASQRRYLADIKRLNQQQAALDRFNDALHAMRSAVAYSQSVNAALDRYQAWGEQRKSLVGRPNPRLLPVHRSH